MSGLFFCVFVCVCVWRACRMCVRVGCAEDGTAFAVALARFHPSFSFFTLRVAMRVVQELPADGVWRCRRWHAARCGDAEAGGCWSAATMAVTAADRDGSGASCGRLRARARVASAPNSFAVSFHRRQSSRPPFLSSLPAYNPYGAPQAYGAPQGYGAPPGAQMPGAMASAVAAQTQCYA